ncbi:MAG: signal recognition particle receptor subunit alpha, partial [Spartobacteria bacterium]
MAAGFFKNFLSRFTGGPVDWDELEETLIRADFGVSMTTLIIKAMRERG